MKQVVPNYQHRLGMRLQSIQKIMVYTVEGPLFFGAISAFDRALNSIHKDPKYLIIRFVKVPL